MPNSTKVVFYDDDESFGNVIKIILEKEFPFLQVATKNNFDPCEFEEADLFFVDDQFNGVSMSAQIVELINVKCPKATVVLLSGMSAVPLTTLVQTQIDEFIDKNTQAISNIINVCRQTVEKKNLAERLSQKVNDLSDSMLGHIVVTEQNDEPKTDYYNPVPKDENPN